MKEVTNYPLMPFRHYGASSSKSHAQISSKQLIPNLTFYCNSKKRSTIYTTKLQGKSYTTTLKRELVMIHRYNNNSNSKETI